MKWLCALLALCMLMPMALAAAEEFSVPAGFDQRREDVTYGKLEFKTYYSTACGRERKCFVYLPPNYDPDREYPLLFLLHGIGGNESEWTGGKPDVVLGNMVSSGEAVEMIVVTPNVKAFPAGASSSVNMYSPEAFAAFDFFINDLRDDLLPFIKANYKIKEGRENMAVAGLSMGGREALYIGLSMPETFGYVGAFCPAPGVLPYYAETGLFATDAFKADENYPTFIMINAGQSDGVVGEWPKTYSDTLTKNGTDHVFYVTAGGHDFNVWKHGLYNFAKNIFPSSRL